MPSVLSRYGIHVDSARLHEMARNYREGLPSKEALMAGVEELVETGLAAAGIGALEQRFGEEKTTLFMKDATDASGAVIKKPDGTNQKRSGTGLAYSIVGAGLGVAAAALVPMTPAWRRRALNVSTGLASAWAYRQGLALGQKWLDSKQPAGTPSQPKPEAPFAQSATAQAEIANVKGALGPGKVVSIHQLVREANERAAVQRRSA